MAKKQPKKEVKQEAKNNGIQVHFGNAEKIKIVLLEAIAKNTKEIVELLRQVKNEG